MKLPDDNDTRCGSGELTVDRLTSCDQIESIRSEWNDLHDELAPGSIHSDVDWYCTIARSFTDNRAPVVFTVRRNKELAGLVAGYYHERRTPLKLGYFQIGHFKAPALSTHYQSCLARNEADLHRTIAETLWNELSNGNARLIYVNALPTEDPLYRLLVKTPFSKGIHLAYPPARHMMMHLGKSLEETIASKGSSVRAFLRRIINRNSRPDAAPIFTVRLFTRSEEIPTYFIDAETVAEKTYQRALNVGFFPTSLHREQVELSAKKVFFRGSILYDGEKPVAFQEDYLCGTHCFNPYVGYDPAYGSKNPGTLLMIKAWDELIKSTKAAIYDFGYGEGLYKERFADFCICEGELLLFSRTLGNVFFYTVLSVDLLINKSVKHLLNSMGIYNVIKKFWRRLKTGNS